MKRTGRSGFGLLTLVYWILLLYIVAALIFWFFSLMKQNDALFNLKQEALKLEIGTLTPQQAQKKASDATDLHRRNQIKYIGEGSTFLLIISIGAVFVYRSVRKQFRVQQQQQNFVMAITHELKTPLSVSRLNLETLLKHKLEQEKQVRLIGMTLEENKRLNNLINNILISSQLEGHSYEMVTEEMDLADLFQEVVQEFRTRYAHRELDADLSPDVCFRGDPLLLKLLLSNLLENANKYSPADAPITLRLMTKESRIILTVTDRGPGVPDAEKKNVFRKFYRLGNEHTRRTKGTGLGLYLCRKIVHDHKGTICIKDNLPQGSTFRVQFPALKN